MRKINTREHVLVLAPGGLHSPLPRLFNCSYLLRLQSIALAHFCKTGVVGTVTYKNVHLQPPELITV